MVIPNTVNLFSEKDSVSTVSADVTHPTSPHAPINGRTSPSDEAHGGGSTNILPGQSDNRIPTTTVTIPGISLLLAVTCTVTFGLSNVRSQ